MANLWTVQYTPRQPNHTRATNNWERKSAYLLREIVKFRTYIDSLTAAQALREKVYAERDKEKSMTEGVEASELVARVAGSGMEIKDSSINRDGKGDGRTHSGGSAREEAGDGGGEGGRGSRGSARSRGRKMKRDNSIAVDGTAAAAASTSKLSDEGTGKGNDGRAAAAANLDMSDKCNAHSADQSAKKGRARAASSMSVGARSISHSRSREFWKVSGSGGDGHADVTRVGAA